MKTKMLAVSSFLFLGSHLAMAADGSASSASSVDKKMPMAKVKKAAAPKKMTVKGLQIKVLKKGKGPAIKSGEVATVHYVGKLKSNGKKFDSSRDRGQPFTFPVGGGQVIKGWDLGVEGMQVGEKRVLTISPELGYGAAGAGGAIPPNATLVFEVELLKIGN